MPRIFSKSLFGRWPKGRKEEQEFGPGKGDIIMCPKGEAVYFQKSWHHALEEYKHLSEDKGIRFELCPADQMKKDGKYEGIVRVEDIPPEVREEVVNLIKNVGQRAFERDVLDRILDVDYNKGTITVTTSENQLAISMGKQIQRARKRAKIDIQLSRQESVARVRVWWE